MALKVKEIAKLVGGKVSGDGERTIQGVAALEEAGPDDLAFAEGEPQAAKASSSRAGCVLVPPGTDAEGNTRVEVKYPKYAFVRAAEALLPPESPVPGIHSTASISPEAKIGNAVNVGAYAVVEEGAIIGDGAWLGAGVYVGEEVKIGTHCRLFPGVKIYSQVEIGNNVILHAGVVLGSDGFGYVYAEGAHHKFPQLGGLVVEEDVEIGANSTVDRGSLGTTRIGRGTKIDNLVQVAHNVRIGRNCIIAAQTGISGSSLIEDGVVLGGQVGVAEGVRIEQGAVAGAQAGIPTGKVIRRGQVVWGTPARPLKEFKRQYKFLSNLPRLTARVREISRRLAGSSQEE